MPEIVAKTILPVLSKDLGIPVMSLVLDEHSSETGFYTRIEAFVDLVKRRKKKSCAQVISLAEERCERVFRTR